MEAYLIRYNNHFVCKRQRRANILLQWIIFHSARKQIEDRLVIENEQINDSIIIYITMSTISTFSFLFSLPEQIYEWHFYIRSSSDKVK